MNRITNFVKKNGEFAFIIPSIVGAMSGSICGSYKGFMNSRHEDYVSNVIITFGGGVIGASTGMVFGFAWPITVAVAALRLLYNDKKE